MRLRRKSLQPKSAEEPSDDDVELTAEKDWAFRRAARWCVPHGLYGLGHTRATMAITMGSKACKAERIRKDCLSSDCSLQLGNMKLESLVNRGSACRGEYVPGPCTHRPSHPGIGFARSIGTNDHP
ncbi:hypothetical protein L1887_61380 [Cichorium endivia]|nr:hypothetical protein L1887_61380 [Cichorium endivia]